MKSLKALFKKYTRTKEQRGTFAVVMFCTLIGLIITAIAPMLVLALFILFVLPGSILFGIFLLIGKWIEKGERY